ncbi:MAG: homoserine O-acetyltransferase [Candidatus Brocadiae bacterium]|nr:homoserine O-acetyltransferase [Candidatus Brocadiia bacterium]
MAGDAPQPDPHLQRPDLPPWQQPDSVGIVQTQYHTFAEPPHPMPLDSGATLGPITLAYETYGQLDETRSNAIFICHALSGDAHVAGYHSTDDHRPGWWDAMVGPGKAFDTTRYFVICANCIAGCSGSTGPASIHPATGRRYARDFPVVTLADMVRAYKALADHLGARKLLAITGGSMGGMQVLEWSIMYPDAVHAIIPIATPARLTAQGIAFNVVGRQAILDDPHYNGGNYYDGPPPNTGLAIARMLGHITYLSDDSMREKFGRQLRDREDLSYDFGVDFEVESYLQHQGQAFTERFDANSYLYITRAVDYFDLAGKYGSLADAFARARARVLLISFTSDWLYPPTQAKEIVSALRANGLHFAYCEVPTRYGHDAFLLEKDTLTRVISDFLALEYSRALRPEAP